MQDFKELLNRKEFQTDRYQIGNPDSINVILDIVHEFLIKSGYFKTLDTLQQEILEQPNLDSYTRRISNETRFGEFLLLEVITNIFIDV